MRNHDVTAGPTAGRIARAVVPASTANLGPGFDSLGMALSLYASVTMQAADRTVIRLHGDHLAGIPVDKTNLVYEVAQSVFRKAGREVLELAIDIESDIPLTRGLGSSSVAIVCALVAANGLIGEPFSRDDLFQMATALENHPDNVGPALFGGIVAAAWDGERAAAVRIEPPDDLDILVAIPAFELSTKKARNVLPAQVSMHDAVFNVSHSSLLTAALAAGRLDVLRHALRDRLHQPYRAPLIPGMETVLREAPARGALGAVLSGAGPTLLLLADRRESRHAELEAFVTDAMAAAGVKVETKWLKPCLVGAVCQVRENNGAPFTDALQPEVGA